MKRNRVGIALSAVGIHASIGSVYAWSVLTKPVMAEMGISLSSTTWAFSIAILFLGLSAAFLGKFVERIGPRASGLLSMLFFCSGLIGTALAVSMKSVALLYFFYGAVGGIGLGIGYITPVSTLVKWFPARRGFATGLAIMGFGFASLIGGPLMQRLTALYGLSTNFLIMGGAYAVVMTLSSLYLMPPKAGETVDLTKLSDDASEKLKKAATAQTGRQYTRREAVQTWEFWSLWWLFFTNITCGIGLLAVASPMAQEAVGMNAAGAAALVGAIGIVNGLGRLAWSTLSDWMGRASTYVLFFVIETAAFFALAQTPSEALFYILVLTIISCYGGGFSCMPAFLSDLFGVRQLSSIHGIMLTAWALAGIAGPMLLSVIKETTGSYHQTMLVFAGLMSAALVLSVILKVKSTKH
ncbi:L-lactate MFS transporter [Sutterella wadsworthensis]|uniref:L-lactate MFS transporter n=1 Tax=Sutterella wadsworthensis TaxID=40545 RepID=UPI00266614CA|nr:OFA family MFS transporter [Sutterella wadsworthensis]